MEEAVSREFRDKVLKGLRISYQKLLKEKKRENSELAFAEDGKVKTVKAVDI